MSAVQGDPKGMRFTKLSLRNWRNFVSVEGIDLQRRMFLVGPNASGKSNLLDVFRFLRDIVSVGGGLQAAVSKPGRGGVKHLRSFAARSYPDIEVSVSMGTDEQPDFARYELRFGQDKHGRAVVRKERIEKKDGRSWGRPDIKDKEDPERLTQTQLEQVFQNEPFRDVVEFLGSVDYFHIIPQLVREPERIAGGEGDPFGGDFLDRVARANKKKSGAHLKRIAKALRVAVPQLRTIELERDRRGRPHLRGKYEHWRPQGVWQSEQQFSDGTLRLIGLLWSVLEGGGPLLLEEPELSLHPEVVAAIPQMFARAQRKSGRQILVSTHSPELLQDTGIGLDEVLLLVPGKEGTRVDLARDLEDIRSLLEGGLSVAEAVLPKTAPRDAEQLSLFGDS